MIIKKITSGILAANCYIAGDEATKKCAVIDPCGNIAGIMKIINELDFCVEYIFNTHYHADHTAGNRKLKKLTGAKILIHKNDVKNLRRLIDEVKFFSLSLGLSPFPDIIIDEEITLRVGNIDFRIYHTPGHTPGGLCFYAEGKLFTGDTLFVGDSGATNYRGGDRSALGASLRRIMKELPGYTVIYPGHDYGPIPTSTLDWEKRNNKNAVEYGYYSSMG